MKYGFRSTAVGAVLLALAFPAQAKVRLERITVSFPGTRTPIVITDPATLELTNPWYGRYVNWSAASAGPPDPESRVYEFTLHARVPRQSDARPIYQFRYVEGRSGQPGSIYLPGRGEPGYRQNVSVILRDGHDGRWSVADPEWESRVWRALRAAK